MVYAILTEQNISRLFLAAYIPGLIAAAGYILAIAIYVRLYPEHAPEKQASSREQFLHSARRVADPMIL
jgi:TRAP-type C4-dicarboxylate transport system permease large subunit